MRGVALLGPFLVAVAGLLPAAPALENGVARRPPLGYNSWYDLGGGDSLNEANLRATADAMVAKGLVAAGYTHLNLDDGFIKPKPKLAEGATDADGRLPDA